VVLLFDGNLDGSKPVSAAAHAISPHGIDVVFAILPIAVFAVGAGANWMKSCEWQQPPMLHSFVSCWG
jgi:hypothetical protein